MAVSLAALFWLEPKRLMKIPEVGDIQIRFTDFKFAQFTTEGMPLLGSGSRGEKFEDYLLVDRPGIQRFERGVTEEIHADSGKIYQTHVMLEGNVSLGRSDGWRMNTPHAFYDINASLFLTEGESFAIHYGKSRVDGKDLVYWQKDGKIEAKTVRARLDETDWKE